MASSHASTSWQRREHAVMRQRDEPGPAERSTLEIPAAGALRSSARPLVFRIAPPARIDDRRDGVRRRVDAVHLALPCRPDEARPDHAAAAGGAPLAPAVAARLMQRLRAGGEEPLSA